MPPFNKSAMDGFAAREEDLSNELEVIETIPAGKEPLKRIGKNQCSRIMTGGVVPEGSDCVIIVEETEETASGRIRFTGILKGSNIALKAEDVKKGDTVLEPGRIISPQDIGIMAAVGNTMVTVGRKPRVGVISSGSELVEPYQEPSVSGIRNSNSYQLMPQIERAGGIGRYYGIARDDEEMTFGLVQAAVSENEIVIITGGVSMGYFDFVPEVLQRAGVTILFSRVAVQPGKPTTFGLHEEAVVFGLPGNPVSSFLLFELLVRPLICKISGMIWKPLTLEFPLMEKFSRRSSDRMALIPVELTAGGMARPVEYHGSAHLTALNRAWGIISVPVGTETIEKGEIVSVRQI
jgi:molybdopterin molybdotransferase